MIVVIAGPSGVSKSYLCWEILADFENFYIPRKATTRPRRPAEDDREYVFVSPTDFQQIKDNAEFEISTHIYGNSYGLLKHDLEDAKQGKKDAILILDVFVAQLFKKRCREATLVYIMPVEREKLAEYIRERAQSYREPQEERLSLLDEELKQSKAFDYVVPFVNSEVAYQLLRSIVIAEGCKPKGFSPEVVPERFLQFRSFPRVAVDLVMANEKTNEIALVERWKEPYGWALPGGFVQYGETVEQAVIREAHEETGAQPVEPQFIGVFSQPDRDPRMHVVSLAYFAKVASLGQAGGDARRVKWFRLEALPNNLVFDHGRMIQDAKRFFTT